jgi:hypothetical protein
MALRMTPVSRNLQTKVRMFGLEIEDLLLLGLLAVGAMLGGQFLFPKRFLFGIPMNWCLMLLVLCLGVPALSLFKYGKPRGYLSDLLNWYDKPHAYSAAEPDSFLDCEYLRED